MTDPLGAPSGAGGTGQSAGPTDQGAAATANAGGQSAPSATGTTTPADGQSTVSREEFDRLRAQLAAADQKRVAAETAHAQLRDKDVPALQKAERDLQEATAALAERDKAMTTLRVENAFLLDNTHDWHDAGTAMKLLDRSRITVDSEGNVTGMKDALTALAKAQPFLLKPAPAGDGQGGAGTGTTPPAPAPGTAPANGGIAPTAGTTPDKAAMARRFPALRQRM